MTEGGALEERRPLTSLEYDLTKWMLENSGHSQRAVFIDQLERAWVVSKCPCGCASIDFAIEGMAPPTGGVGIIGDYVVGTEDAQYGIFVFEQSDVLSGVEVYSQAAEAPSVLPRPEELRDFDADVPAAAALSGRHERLHRFTTWDMLFQIGAVLGLMVIALLLVLTERCSL